VTGTIVEDFRAIVFMKTSVESVCTFTGILEKALHSRGVSAAVCNAWLPCRISPQDVVQECRRILKKTKRAAKKAKNADPAVIYESVREALQVTINSGIFMAFVSGKIMGNMAQARQFCTWTIDVIQLARSKLEPAGDAPRALALKGDRLKKSFEQRVRVFAADFFLGEHAKKKHVPAKDMDRLLGFSESGVEVDDGASSSREARAFLLNQTFCVAEARYKLGVYSQLRMESAFDLSEYQDHDVEVIRLGRKAASCYASACNLLPTDDSRCWLYGTKALFCGLRTGAYTAAAVKELLDRIALSKRDSKEWGDAIHDIDEEGSSNNMSAKFVANMSERLEPVWVHENFQTERGKHESILCPWRSPETVAKLQSGELADVTRAIVDAFPDMKPHFAESGGVNEENVVERREEMMSASSSNNPCDFEWSLDLD